MVDAGRSDAHSAAPVPASSSTAPTRANAASDLSPNLAADGLTVAWMSNRAGDFDIYVAPADGTGAPLNITATQVDEGIEALAASLAVLPS